MPQSRCGRLGEEKTLLLLPGIEPPPYYSVVDIQNEAALVVRRGYERMFEIVYAGRTLDCEPLSKHNYIALETNSHPNLKGGREDNT